MNAKNNTPKAKFDRNVKIGVAVVVLAILGFLVGNSVFGGKDTSSTGAAPRTPHTWTYSVSRGTAAFDFIDYRDMATGKTVRVTAEELAGKESWMIDINDNGNPPSTAQITGQVYGAGSTASVTVNIFRDAKVVDHQTKSWKPSNPYTWAMASAPAH